ncbi:MAG: DUF5683 domain-containing protein [candidate division Zixibacteria bacterium]|nr:DUF5683 domain-containing protein [candidate division Zixibacteria bacterium]
MVAAQGGGNLQITTNPSGALVTLKGDLTLSGIAPVQFDRTLVGRYRVEITRDGFERYRSTSYLSESLMTKLDVKLVPKTRVKAFFRSLVIPGWGQRYYGNATKSTFLLLGTVAAAAGYVVVKDDYDSKVDDYNERIADRAAATKWTDLSRLNREVRDAQAKANDAEDRVNIMTAIAAGIYAFNLLDAFLLFPEFDTFSEYKPLSVQPRTDLNRIGVTVSLKF